MILVIMVLPAMKCSVLVVEIIGTDAWMDVVGLKFVVDNSCYKWH